MTYPVTNARATIRFWPDGGKVTEGPLAASLAPVINLRHSPAENEVSLRISANVPWYRPKSEILSLRRGAVSRETLALVPVALRCGECGRAFGFGDTMCSPCKRPRTKWPTGRSGPE
jgi:hypothetical protein